MNARRHIAIAAAVAIALLPFYAGADDGHGPDHYRVAGLKPGTALVLHRKKGPNSDILAYIPHDARRLKNLGCKGGLTLPQWQKATPEAREKSKDRRWCKVSYKAVDGKTVTGWVNGRYLRED